MCNLLDVIFGYTEDDNMTMIESGTRSGRVGAGDDVRSWHEVEPGYWVGNTDGAFLGTIEETPAGRFAARNAISSHLGEYSTLSQARWAIMIDPDSREQGGTHASNRRSPRGRASLRRAAQHA
jgi:hypothetical protein